MDEAPMDEDKLRALAERPAIMFALACGPVAEGLAELGGRKRALALYAEVWRVVQFEPQFAGDCWARRRWGAV